MTQPFLGQIQPFGFNFAPRGWALCDGQILSIQQNTALFSLLGTYYGGNGTTNFALPDLRSRVPVGQGQLSGGSQYFLGETDGVESVILNIGQTPMHTHTFAGTSAHANAARVASGVVLGAIWKPAGGGNPGDNYYGPDTNPQALNPACMTPWGSGAPQAHTNIQPYLTISWCIALQGIYPTRN